MQSPVLGYRTIVADPPWDITRPSNYSWRKGNASGKRMELPYATMTTPEISALPVHEMSASDAHLYIWTVNARIEDAYTVARMWGFKPLTLLTWCKAPFGFGGGGAFAQTSEHILFSRRGVDVRQARCETTWWNWKRGQHSAKPEAFLDIVERVSPAPRLEMFARRNRLGWDTWGHEALQHVEIGAA